MIDREIIGRFIDASVNDQQEAKRLLDENPALRSAKWLGDEHLLNFLVIENFPDGVRFCLENGFDPEQSDGEFGDTPLINASACGYGEVAKILLKHGANPNVVSQTMDTPIDCCFRGGHADLLDLLFTHGAELSGAIEFDLSTVRDWPEDRSAIAVVLRKHNVI